MKEGERRGSIPWVCKEGHPIQDKTGRTDNPSPLHSLYSNHICYKARCHKALPVVLIYTEYIKEIHRIA